MKRGYIRVSKLTPEVPQEAALRRDGFKDFSDAGDVWKDIAPARKQSGQEDHLPWRARAINGCRAGDVIVVASLAAWAASTVDGATAMEALARKGGVLRVLDTDTTYSGGEAMAGAMKFFADMQGAVHAATIRPAQEAAALRLARKADKERDQRKEAKALWENADLTTQQVVARVPFSERTMYRWWGKRHPEPALPAPKGRRK